MMRNTFPSNQPAKTFRAASDLSVVVKHFGHCAVALIGPTSSDVASRKLGVVYCLRIRATTAINNGRVILVRDHHLVMVHILRLDRGGTARAAAS